MKHWLTEPKKWLGLSLLIGIGIRVFISVTDFGVYWHDEIFQSLEPAHSRAFGYGLLPWEFVAGARSFLFPWLLSSILWFTKILGIDHPFVYLLLTRLFLI